MLDLDNVILDFEKTIETYQGVSYVLNIGDVFTYRDSHDNDKQYKLVIKNLLRIDGTVHMKYILAPSVRALVEYTPIDEVPIKAMRHHINRPHMVDVIKEA